MALSYVSTQELGRLSRASLQDSKDPSQKNVSAPGQSEHLSGQMRTPSNNTKTSTPGSVCRWCLQMACVALGSCRTQQESEDSPPWPSTHMQQSMQRAPGMNIQRLWDRGQGTMLKEDKGQWRTGQ
jgi:hypothetical protein